MDNNQSNESPNPKIFVSYSHDSDEHRSWVLRLASRLRENGVDVDLDQWNTPLGSDLQLFMEQAAFNAPKIIAVISDDYLKKANHRDGGVGVEKNLLSARILENQREPLVIPLLRNNTTKELPRFLANAKYINFNDDDEYEDKYKQLIYDIYGQSVIPIPPLGPNPFETRATPPFIAIQQAASKYSSPSTTGTVEFDYSNNNGRFTLGSGVLSFETVWTQAGSRSIYAYSDGQGIQSIALAEALTHPDELGDLSRFDFTSRVRMPETGDSIIWLNDYGRLALTRIDEVLVSHSKPRIHRLKLTYWLDVGS